MVVWSIPSAVAILAIIGVLSFILLVKFWSKIIRGLLMYGTAPLSNIIETYPTWSKYLSWNLASIGRTIVALIKCFWPPILYWDNMIARNFWWGVAGIALWFVFTWSIAGTAVRKWFHIKHKSNRLFARILVTAICMLVLGKALPNTRTILVPRALTAIATWTANNPEVTILASVLTLLPTAGYLVWGLSQTTWVKKRRRVQPSRSSTSPSNVTEMVNKLKSLPKVSKREQKDYEDGSSGHWYKKMEYPEAGILVKDLGVNRVSLSSIRATIQSDRGVGEVLKTKNGKFITYL